MRWWVVAAEVPYSVYISVFSRPQNCPRVSDVVFISDGRLFHAVGPATEKLRGPKLTVLVRCTARSPWPAERKWWRVRRRDCRDRSDRRYKAASWWRHLCTSRQILVYTLSHQKPMKVVTNGRCDTVTFPFLDNQARITWVFTSFNFRSNFSGLYRVFTLLPTTVNTVFSES